MKRSVLLLLTLAACGGLADGSPGDDSGGAPDPSGGPSAGKLTAGEYDDNKNFGLLLQELDELFRAELPKGTLPIADRIAVTVTADGVPLSNATVAIVAGGTPRVSVPTGTDGRVLLFPGADGFAGATDAVVQVTYDEAVHQLAVPAGTTWNLDIAGAAPAKPTGLDVAFVVDATGSMGDEISFLKAELRDIIQRSATDFPAISRRYALIVYRDTGDDYVVRKFAFTDNLDGMLDNLAEQSADGGGDYPEAAEQAMSSALELAWRGGNVARVLFHVADAPPHDSGYKSFLASATAARAKGVRIFPIAASGVALEAEYLMRLSALETLGRYLFLTDDSGIGDPHVPPHLPCFQVQHLNDLMARTIASELAGAYIAAPDTDVVRTVGEYHDGVCGALPPSPRAGHELAAGRHGRPEQSR